MSCRRRIPFPLFSFFPFHRHPSHYDAPASRGGLASNLPVLLLVMDTAPAAVLGATLDPVVAKRERQLIVNVGNFHTIAFRLRSGRIEGVFEHHTGEIDRENWKDCCTNWQTAC